jgi:hypothetical protein
MNETGTAARALINPIESEQKAETQIRRPSFRLISGLENTRAGPLPFFAQLITQVGPLPFVYSDNQPSLGASPAAIQDKTPQDFFLPVR